MRRQSGFTLVELAIVLVIIGLIVGGILVGKDLVQTAAIRSSISQIERYNQATNAFRLKYNNLPGDLPNGQNYGFSFRWSNAIGSGDGNGLLQQRFNAGDSQTISGEEYILFWNDLTRVGLISEGLDPTLTYVNWNCPSMALMPSYYPSLKIRDAAYLTMYIKDSKHYYLASNSTNGWLHATPMFSPAEAYYIDAKLDDGMPSSGLITVADLVVWNAVNAATPGATSCNTSSTAYNMSPTYNNRILCALGIRTGF